MTTCVLEKDIVIAYKRIKDKIRKTPLEYSAWLSQCSASNVYIKLEHEQMTNSFKLRGATNKILKLKENPDSCKDIVTASSGNHALACAKALQGQDLKCIICVRENTSLSKIKGLERFGANVLRHGTDCLDTEKFARNLAQETGALYLSPYNDLDVIAGQGTIGIEVLQDLPDIDAIFLSVGGGGLISGVASYFKEKKPSVKIIGCQPENSKVMYESIKAGKILDLASLETLSDGTAGGIDEGAVTFEICKSLVDDWVLVTEDEISLAVFKMMEEHSKIVEGASGVAIAAFLKTKEEYKNKKVVIVSCGANISTEKIKKVLEKHCNAVE